MVTDHPRLGPLAPASTTCGCLPQPERQAGISELCALSGRRPYPHVEQVQDKDPTEAGADPTPQECRPITSVMSLAS